MSASTRDVAGSSAPEHPATRPLSRQLGRAAFWSGLNSFVLRLGQFGVGVVAAHLIAPDQFGVYAVALTVQAVIVNVSELGVSAALVRARDNVAEVARVVALISILSGTALTAAMICAAPWLAGALGAGSASDAIRILAGTVFLGGVSAVPYALLVREFRQDKRFLADGANFVVSSATLVVLALFGDGATALATSRVLGQLTTTIILFVIVTPRYGPRYHRGVVRGVLRYSLPLAGADIVAFALTNADYVVVARILGALPLGFYMLAYNISGWPVSVLGLVINEVALPAFARARDDRVGLPHRARGALTLTAMIAFPISALILALSQPLVDTVYGSRWADATTALAILGLFGSTRIVIGLLVNMLAALGRSRNVLAVQVSWIVALVPALVVGVRWHGIVGAAVAQEVVSLGVVLPLALVLTSRAGCGPVRSMLAAFAMPVVAAAVAGGVSYGVSAALEPTALRLVAGGLAGVLSYAIAFGPRLRRLIRQLGRRWDEPSQPHDPVWTAERTQPA